MRKSNFKALLISVLAFLVFVPVTYSKNEVPNKARNDAKKQPDLIITCPVDVVYRLQEIPDWNPGLSGMRLQFESASAFENTLSCTYEYRGATATIMRAAPQGYVCTAKNVFGAKNRQIVCKRNVPPIKIRPRN